MVTINRKEPTLSVKTVRNLRIWLKTLDIMHNYQQNMQQKNMGDNRCFS